MGCVFLQNVLPFLLHFCAIFTAFCSISTAFCGARAAQARVSTARFRPTGAVRCNGAYKANKYPKECRASPAHTQAPATRAAGACKAYHTVDVNHTCPAWRAAHTHTAQLSSRAGEHPWGFGAKRKRLLRLLFGLEPLCFAVSFATRKGRTTRTKLPATICCGVPFASAEMFLAPL